MAVKKYGREKFVIATKAPAYTLDDKGNYGTSNGFI